VAGAGLAVLLALVITIAVVGGGSDTKLPLRTPTATTRLASTVDAQHQIWEHTRDHDYEYTLTMASMCGVVSLRISVNLATVTAAAVTHSGCGVTNSTPERLIGPYAPRSIDQVFDEVAADYSDGYGMKVTYDAARGFPASVAVDPIRNAIDDEYQISLTDYQRLPQ